jgi:hypothetical protein
MWIKYKKLYQGRVILVWDSNINEWVTFGEDANFLHDHNFDGRGWLPAVDDMAAMSYIHVRDGYEEDAVITALLAGKQTVFLEEDDERDR